MDKDNRTNCKQGPGMGGIVVAFLTGAGVATTAFLIASKAKRGWKPSAESLLKKCDRAFNKLDNQISQDMVA